MIKITTIEKVLKIALPIFIGLVVFALFYVYLVVDKQLNVVFGIIMSLIIGSIVAGLFCFWLFVFLLSTTPIARKVKNAFKLCFHSPARKKQNEEPSDKEDNEYTDSPVVVSEMNESIEEDKWEKTKEELRNYVQKDIFPFFPQEYHPALLQIIEDFASNNVACSSPIKCTLEETTPRLKAYDVCHIVGNLYIKFKEADKNRVMTRETILRFTKNAFPNIITQGLSYVRTHLVQHDEPCQIPSFPQNSL